MNPEENVQDFIGELNAGAFVSKLDVVLKTAALSALTHKGNKVKSKISIDLVFDTFGKEAQQQVKISHKIKFHVPTAAGDKGETDIGETVLFVHPKGVMKIEPPQVDKNGQMNILDLNRNPA